MFDNGHPSVLLDLVAYDTVKTLRALLRQQARHARYTEYSVSH